MQLDSAPRFLCLSLLAIAILVCGILQSAETPLDRYVAKPDRSYSWEVVRTLRAEGVTTFIVDLKSQTWRSESEVSRTLWQHWLIVTRPDNTSSETAMLMIGGGRNGKDPPGPDKQMAAFAVQSRSIVATLTMVPNQPLEFRQDGKQRSEDDLVAYSWDQFLKTGDPTWPARNPMVKSAVRAMDTVTALAASEQGGRLKVDRFVVAGGSKRGWTTWLTAAPVPSAGSRAQRPVRLRKNSIPNISFVNLNAVLFDPPSRLRSSCCRQS